MRSEKQWTTATVTGIHPAAEDIRLFELEPEGGATPYKLGSHIDVALMVEGRSILRSYSVVGSAPVAGAWRIAVRRVGDSRGGSRAMWGLKHGDALRITRPRSHFELGFGRPEYVLVAGGIGITPILGMADALNRTKHRFRLLYAGRRRRQMAFLTELEHLLGDRLQVFCSEEGSRIDLAGEIARLHREGEMYVCGPVQMMEAARELWRASGRAPTSLRFETFGSSGHLPLQPFTAKLQDHGIELHVSREQSLLEALQNAGIEIAYDCLRGECGLCQVTVLSHEGPVDHRDVFLSEVQKHSSHKLCACVSRGTGTITIDTGFRRELRGVLPRTPGGR
ncbi:MAG: oxidoreductase [Acetobacteraceae bacterium]|nr:oxidoreductase [Acetobacteraceae bacterium]